MLEEEKVINKTELTKGVHGLRMDGKCGSEDVGTYSKGGKDRVSFGTNMPIDEEESESGNVDQVGDTLDMAVARFHARKFGALDKRAAEKRHRLKVQDMLKNRKRR
jgi:hypothetical protein